jgi:hypothetical protein
VRVNFCEAIKYFESKKFENMIFIKSFYYKTFDLFIEIQTN